MAAKTPVVDNTTDGYVVPGKGVYGGVSTTTNNLLSDVDTHLADRNGLQLRIFYFGPSNSANDIDDGDTWTSNISNIFALAWQPADATDDKVSPSLTTQATGVVTFTCENATNNEGWLWVLSGS